MSPQTFQGGMFAPFSNYPVTRRFKNSKVPPTIFILTILAWIGLIIWNVLTQGDIKTTQSVIMSHYTQTDNITCQPAIISVGQSLFTVATPNAREDAHKQRGGFEWVVGSVTSSLDGDDSVATGFLYSGGALHCNITSVGLTYRYTEQSYLYGACALCEAPIPNSTTTGNYVTICTNYDLATANLPTFTQNTQQVIQDRIFGLGGPTYYQQYRFPASSLPAVIFPPYNNASNTLVTSAVTPKDVVQLAFWLNGISYTVNTSATHTFNRPNGTVYVNADPSGTPYSSLSKAFLATTVPQWTYTPNAPSGMQLAVAGIGGLQPLWTPGAPNAMTAPFPDVYQYAITTLGLIMDRAGADTDGRSLGAVYLCTVSGREWKNWLELVALVIGNSVGVVAVALTAMITLAKSYDSGADDSDALVDFSTRGLNKKPSLSSPIPFSSSASSDTDSKPVVTYEIVFASGGPEPQRGATYPS